MWCLENSQSHGEAYATQVAFMHAAKGDQIPDMFEPHNYDISVSTPPALACYSRPALELSACSVKYLNLIQEFHAVCLEVTDPGHLSHMHHYIMLFHYTLPLQSIGH
jgi:hypothetical protein